jgi:membrane protease YdiL (CAAX protease family)
MARIGDGLARLPLTFRAIVGGLLIGLSAANVWPILLLALGAPLASVTELVFLAFYLWWASGHGWPRRLQAVRRDLARANPLPRGRWGWGLLAAVAFAVVVHAAIVLLFRLTPFPAAAFHAGYDFGFIPGLPLKWLVCIISAVSAGVCEEMGFRGYMQRPIEIRHGPALAIAISSTLFMLLHLNKSWSLVAMTPIVFGAGVLLGILAWRSGTLVFCMIGHAIMDVGLFAYWWTQVAGTFPQRPIFETGLEPTIFVEAAVFATAAALFFLALVRLGSKGATAGSAGGDPANS